MEKSGKKEMGKFRGVKAVGCRRKNASCYRETIPTRRFQVPAED